MANGTTKRGRRFLVAAMVVVAIGLLAGTTVAAKGAAPAMPHPVAGKEACLACHDVGSPGAAMPADHEGRAVSTCTACHTPPR